MLTLFTTPKPFRGKFNVVQRNAIISWTLLRPKPEIIILGDDEGTAEIAAELGLIHIPHIDANEYGTPLVSSIFAKSEAAARNDLMCYVNADIILMSDFMEAVKKCNGLMAGRQFLMVGRKRNVPIPELLEFGRSDWESRLHEHAVSNGIYGTTDSDYFLYRKGFWRDMPPFAIGRDFWSLWFPYMARVRKAPVIDATSVVMAVESRHDYSHAVSNTDPRGLSGIELRRNWDLFKGCKHYTTVDATHVLTSEGLRKRPLSYPIRSLWIRAERRLAYWGKEQAYPYSLPFILLYRMARPLWTKLRALACKTA